MKTAAMKCSLGISLLLVMLVLACSSQKTSPKLSETSNFATIQGRAFLITRGGDLKPARMANVYLLTSPTVISETLKYTEENTAHLTKLGEESKAAAREYDIPSLSAAANGPLGQCSSFIRDFENAIRREQKKGSEMLVAQADEEGNFSFDHVPPHEYFLTAVGGAGSYLAIWQSTENVESGQKLTLKLSSTVASCPTVY